MILYNRKKKVRLVGAVYRTGMLWSILFYGPTGPRQPTRGKWSGGAAAPSNYFYTTWVVSPIAMCGLCLYAQVALRVSLGACGCLLSRIRWRPMCARCRCLTRVVIRCPDQPSPPVACPGVYSGTAAAVAGHLAPCQCPTKWSAGQRPQSPPAVQPIV